jgi:sec-independent protein translocase protein TatB
MLSLSPAKILVILVIALIVLGPDKLPSMARQAGAVWHDLRKLRGRLESEVRGAFPDLPSTEQVARAVRSPLSYLDGLADKHAASTGAEGSGPGPAPNGSAGAGAGSGATGGGGSPNGNGHAGAGASASSGASDAGAAAGTPGAGVGDLPADDPSMN